MLSSADMSAQTVPIHYVHRMLRVAERRGFDVVPLLRDAGIPEDVAGHAKARITVGQFGRAARRLLVLTDDELFGLGPRVPRGTFRLIGLSLIHAPDLRTVLGRLADASAVLAGVPRITVTEDGGQTTLAADVSALDDPEHLGAEVVATLAHRFSGWLIGRRIALRAVELPYPEPAYALDYYPILGRMPLFGAERVALTFDSVLPAAPLVRSEADLLAYIDLMPGNFFATRDHGSTTADRVRKILEGGLRGTWPTSHDIAARLAVSVQHLRRMLREEKTSVGRIREELLRDAAVTSLARGEEPVEDLARRLGYSEASAFRRAFRRWTGSPPGAYRPTH